jgi:excisionase family DNA binding protein
MDRRVYTVEEVAEILGIARGKAYEHINANDIPGVIHLGRRILISKPVFDSWLDDNNNVIQAAA